MKRTFKQAKRMFASNRSPASISPPTPKGNTIKKATPIGAYSVSTAGPNAPSHHLVDCDIGAKLTELSPPGSTTSHSTPVSGHVESPSGTTNEENRDIARGITPYHQQRPLVTAPGKRPELPELPDAMSPAVVTSTNTILEDVGHHDPSRHHPSASRFTRRQPQKQPHPTLNLLLGRQDSKSLYFTQRNFRVPDPENIISSSSSARSDTSHLSIPDLDPHAFDLYNIYMHTGKISDLHQASFYSLPAKTAEHTWQACWPLMNAHILGCIIDEPDFADRIMDSLISKIPSGTCADRATITHLFDRDRNDVTHALMRFVVDRCVGAGAEHFTELNASTLPPSFVHLSLVEALQRLSSRTAEVRSNCVYHTHKSPEECYRRKITLSQLRQESRLQSAQELSRKDAARVLTDAAQNDIQVIDWDQRRTYRNLVSAERFGERSIDHMSRTTGRRVLDSIVELTRNSNLETPTVSVQHTAFKKSGLGMTPPAVASVARATQEPGLNTPQIRSPEPPAPTAIMAELQGSTIAVSETASIVPKSGNSLHQISTPIPGRSSVGQGDEAVVLVEHKKWPGAYPESDLGNE